MSEEQNDTTISPLADVAPGPSDWQPQQTPLADVSYPSAVRADPSAKPTEQDQIPTHQRLATMEASLTTMERILQNKLAYDRFKEEQIDRLHRELQEYKQDLLGRITRPLLSGIVAVHEDVERAIANVRSTEANDLPRTAVIRLFSGIQDALEILLEQHGVDRFEVAGQHFDPRRQTAIERVANPDAACAGCIASRIRPGFEQGEQVLRKERVAVFSHGVPEKSAARIEFTNEITSPD